MVPMITDISELEAVRAAISDCRAELERGGAKIPPVPVGIMIETPAAALCADALALVSDYFSIGTNDLTQYCMAVDRGNASVAALYKTTHPAVESLVGNTVKAAHAAGIKVSVCGEAAANPAAISMFLRLGVDSLSVTPAAAPEVKEIVRSFEI
jgi:phosphoenolpyruvate-protein kinase (PTS system EI component)